MFQQPSKPISNSSFVDNIQSTLSGAVVLFYWNYRVDSKFAPSRYKVTASLIGWAQT